MEKRYNIIYADPPWKYDRQKGEGVAADIYQTMSLAEIESIPVNEIAADDAVLFLWVTFPKLKEGLSVIESWGFKYKTCAFNWVKRCRKQQEKWFWGLGFWTRANPELCLIATKGQPKRVSKAVHCIVDTPVEEHSKKPDIVREKIVELAGNLPRAELFARNEYPGWVCVGNEIDGMDIRDSLQMLKER